MKATAKRAAIGTNPVFEQRQIEGYVRHKKEGPV
jgi:hypothetical protein